MSNNFPCWHCGKPRTVNMSFSRREVCEQCNADQHVCRLCEHYDNNIADQCREDRADAISDKEKANFCDYFLPSANAYAGGNQQKQLDAKAKLEALFGSNKATNTDSHADNSADNVIEDKQTAAKKALEDLFSPPADKE